MDSPVALITGASSGFGAAIAERLSQRPVKPKLILLARRGERLKELSRRLSTPCHTIACDLRDYEAVKHNLANLPQEFAAIDVLVNNAGLALGLEPAHRTDWQDWLQMIETNCTALAYLTRLVLPGMVERQRGHIVMIGSVAGHYAYPGGNAYCASKAFVEQFARALRADLVDKQVRVTHIAPGLAAGTEFSEVRFHGDKAKAAAVYAGTQPLTAEDVADCVDWVTSRPAHVNINSIELMPVCQASGALQVVRQNPS